MVDIVSDDVSDNARARFMSNTILRRRRGSLASCERLAGCSRVSGGNYVFTLDKPASVMARRHMLEGYISQ